MKKLLFIGLFLLFAFVACEETNVTVDKLTEQESEAIQTLLDAGDVQLKHLERYLIGSDKPLTRGDGIPSCWGRRSIKIDSLINAIGLTDKDIDKFIQENKSKE